MTHYLVLHIDLEFIAGAIYNANGGLPIKIEKEEFLWLYFFNNSSQKKISFGKENKKYFLDKAPNYYGNFFDQILDPNSKFESNGLSWPIIDLLEDSGILKLLIERYEQRTRQTSTLIPTLLTFSSSIKKSAKIMMIEYLSSKQFKIESSVIELPELISYYYWKKNKINVNRDKVIICLQATNSTLYITKLIFIDGFFIIDPGAAVFENGKGNDTRKKAIIEFVIDYVTKETLILQTDEQNEKDRKRFESVADDWIREVDNAPKDVPVLIEQIGLSPALTIKKNVLVRKETIEKNTGSSVMEIINIYNNYITRNVKYNETVAAVILLGECFRNSLMEARFDELLKEKLIISPLPILFEILSVYPRIDFKILDDPDKRKILIEKAIKLDDEEKEIIKRKNEAIEKFSISKVLISESKLIEAVATLENAKELDPNNAEISKFYIETKKFSEEFSNVLTLEADGRLEEALKQLKRLKKLFGSIDFMDPIAKLNNELEDLQEKRNLKQIEEKVLTYLESAKRFLEQKQYQATLNELKNASKLNSQNQEIQILQTEAESSMLLQNREFGVVKEEADELFAAEDYVEAEKKYKEALNLMYDVECINQLKCIPKLIEEKNYFETTIHSANTFFANGKYYEALENYKRAEKLAKSSKKEEFRTKISECKIKIAAIEIEVDKLLRRAKELKRKGLKEDALKSFLEAQKLKHDESIANIIKTLKEEIEKDLLSKPKKVELKPQPQHQPPLQPDKLWRRIQNVFKNGSILQKVIIAGSIFIILFISTVVIGFLSKGGHDGPILPSPAGPISGLKAVSQGQTGVTYNTASIENATTYNWTLPDGAIGSSNTNSIIVNFSSKAVSGNISVNGKNSRGDGKSSFLAITVNPGNFQPQPQEPPSQAGDITGPATVSKGQSSVNYSVPTIANATTYLWSLPEGAAGSSNTNIINVNFYDNAVSGNISVKGKNSSGEGPSSSLAITVNKGTKPPPPPPLVPSQPGTISGPATVTQGQSSVTYSVPPIANATTYIWSLPSGATGSGNTNSISVSYNTTAVSGNISVKGKNSNGEGRSSSLAIIVNRLGTSPPGHPDTTIILPDGNSYRGQVNNAGRPHGEGRLTFTRDGIISKNDPMENKAKAGDYLVGKWTNGELTTGKLFDRNGNLKAIINL